MIGSLALMAALLGTTPALAEAPPAVLCLKVVRGVDSQLYVGRDELVDASPALQRRGCVALAPGYLQVVVVGSFRKSTVGDALLASVDPLAIGQASGALVSKETIHELQLEPGQVLWAKVHSRTTGATFRQVGPFEITEKRRADWHQPDALPR